MKTGTYDPELHARIIDGTLTAEEWELVRAIISEQTIREILDQDARLRSIMHSIASSESNPVHVQQIMTAVMGFVPRSRTFIRVTELIPYIGVALFLAGIGGVFVMGYVPILPELNISIPALDHVHATWVFAAVILFGAIVWRTESA